jgi:hypothetical protein
MRGRGTPQPAWLEAGLRYLRTQQLPTGGWKAGTGYQAFNLGVTALAALAFLAGGVSPEEGSESGQALAAGIALLLKAQDAEGCIGSRTDPRFVYGHAFATLALVETFAATGDPKVRIATQKALDFIATCRNPYFAWRYGVKPGDNDTSVTGCMVAALHAARLVNRAADAAGLPPAFTYDEEAFDGVQAWINKMTDPDLGIVGYQQRGARGTEARLDAETAARFPPENSRAVPVKAGISSPLWEGGSNPVTVPVLTW